MPVDSRTHADLVAARDALLAQGVA